MRVRSMLNLDSGVYRFLDWFDVLERYRPAQTNAGEMWHTGIV